MPPLPDTEDTGIMLSYPSVPNVLPILFYEILRFIAGFDGGDSSLDDRLKT
jgi:hypothetical protein